MIDTETIALRLAVAAVLGGIVGLERERVESAAGLRTHALVAVGASLLMIVSMFGFRDAVHAPDIVLDPSRVAAQIVSGIGFLGAGVIIFRREIIRGLTTAASVWVVAAVGMAVGGGLYLAAAIAAALSLGILAVMKPLERRLMASRRTQGMRVILDARRVGVQAVLAKLAALGLVPQHVSTRFVEDGGKARVEIAVRRTSDAAFIGAIEAIAAQPGVREVRASTPLHLPKP